MVSVNTGIKPSARTIMLRCSDTRLVAMVSQTTTDQVGDFELHAALSVMQCVIPGVTATCTLEALLWSLLNTYVDT